MLLFAKGWLSNFIVDDQNLKLAAQKQEIYLKSQTGTFSGTLHDFSKNIGANQNGYLYICYLGESMLVKSIKKGLGTFISCQTLYYLVPGTRIELVQGLSPEGF